MKLRHKDEDSPGGYRGHGVATRRGDEVEVDDDVGEALLATGHFERVDEPTASDVATDDAVSTAESEGSDAEDGSAEGSDTCADDNCSRTVADSEYCWQHQPDGDE